MPVNSTTKMDLLIVSGIYLAATALYALLGVRFDASTFPSYMQFIDQDLLEQRLLESLWYYHGNPPGLNLLTGIGLKLAGAGAPTFFSFVFHLFGALTAWSVFALTQRLCASRAAAVVVTTILVFSPQFTLYQNWYMYEFLSMTMLTFSAYALFEFVRTRTTKWGTAFFATLALLLLTRSLFHLAWMVVVAALLVQLSPGRRRQVLAIAIAPILCVALWYGKNDWYFGKFGASTWMGLGLSNITTLMVPKNELAPLVRDGALTKWALISRHENRSALFRDNLRPPTGIPALDRMRKSDGSLNFNYRDIPVIDRFYTSDALTVARRLPMNYGIGLIFANLLYFSPTSMNAYFDPANRAAVRPIEKVYNVAMGAHAQPSLMRSPHFGLSGHYENEVNASLALLAAWWVVIGYGYVQARRGILRGVPEEQPRSIVIGYIVLTAVYLYFVSSFLELNENYRYRFNIEPLMFVLGTVAVTALTRAVRGRIAARRDPAHPV